MAGIKKLFRLSHSSERQIKKQCIHSRLFQADHIGLEATTVADALYHDNVLVQPYLQKALSLCS